ncbi:MAG: ABC transporter permease subunit [Lachnospiraceae bacterium]|nr:ABC transporter permease subunit [Lachnospiraceae bacterium]
MIIVRHSMRQGRNMLIIWSAVIAFMLAVCILIYPEMGSQMSEISGMFSDMGGFSAAFGMDKINFGEFMGYFGVECGNVLGLGGAFFAALLGISALAGEEREHTAEFLLTHPVSRRRIITEKLVAVLLQVVLLNAAVLAVTCIGVLAIGESPDVKALTMLFFAYLILQIEVAAVCFGISAFISRGGLGMGIGLTALLYFLNIISNLTQEAGFLKYITPYGYTDGAYIITNAGIEIKYMAAGLIFTAVGILAAYLKFEKKDIM